MKYLNQFLIIILISFIGELLKYLLAFTIPASIYGMILLFLALECNIIKLESVKACSTLLIEWMPLMFVPAGVGLLKSWDVLKTIWMQVMIITIISTILVMGVSGLVTQKVIRSKKRKEQK